MSNTIARSWCSTLVHGLLSAILGILILSYPGLTVGLLIIFFAAYAFVSGLFNSIAAIANRKNNEDWSIHLIEGLVGIGVGILVWTWPGISALLLLYVIAAWAVITGILQVLTAIKLRKHIKHEFLLGICGIISLIFGIYVFRFPGAGALALAWVIGIYTLAIGILLVILSFQIKHTQKVASDQ